VVRFAWAPTGHRALSLLAGDEVVEAAHDLNAASRAVDWHATGETSGTLTDWRDRNRAVFRAVNAVREATRVDSASRVP
jgi:hypothetical protein